MDTNILIIGNGPSSKQILDYGWDKFIYEAKQNGFIIICMNKIIRYFKQKEITNFPDYYVAADSAVGVNIISEIIPYLHKFKKNYISVPVHLDKSKRTFKKHSRGATINTNLKESTFEQLQNDIIYLSNNPNVNITTHNNTGCQSLILAEELALCHKSNIFLIGYDESYDFAHAKIITLDSVSSENLNHNYFTPDYLKENDIISVTNPKRINDVNAIINDIQKRGILVFNLSDISKIQSGLQLKFHDFINTYIK